MPAVLRLGSSEVGPNALLQAACAFLGVVGGGEPHPPGPVRLRASCEYAALACRDDFQKIRYRNAWSIFPSGFEAPNLAEMARWQAWSGKPAIVTRNP